MAVFETISNTNANFLNLHIDKATKTRGDIQFYLLVITHFTKQTFKPKLFTANIECNSTDVKVPKTEKAILFLNLNSHSMVMASYFSSLSTLLHTSDLNGTDLRNFIRLNAHITSE